LGESRSKRWTEDKSSIIVGYAEKVLSVMDVERIQLGDMQAIQRNAVKLSISFYDSALLTYAKVMNRTLVTEDEQLARAAKVLKVVCLGVKEMDISSCSCIS
jgi:predicted nucleic acid-binding protein